MLSQPIVQRHLIAKHWRRPSPGSCVRRDTNQVFAPIRSYPPFTLDVPEQARRFVSRYAQRRRAICILPVSGSGLAQSSSPAAWGAIARALADAFPAVTLFFTGVTKAGLNGQRSRSGFDREDLARIAARVPGVVECLDVGLWNQIALAERCDISPRRTTASLSSPNSSECLADDLRMSLAGIHVQRRAVLTPRCRIAPITA